MYKNKKLNTILLLSSLLVFVIALALLRTQTPIGDQQYMKAMIPHHSSAILTSKMRTLKTRKCKKLSEEIIQAQVEEIAQMKEILRPMDK
jgi:uncharacterized protein (DUF305 family)